MAQVLERGTPTGASSPSGVRNRSLLVPLGIMAVVAGFALPAILTGKPQLPDLGSAAEIATKNPTGYTPPEQPEPSNSGMLLLRLVLGTMAVSALGIGLLWSSRRWLSSGATASRGGNQLRLLESLSLNYRCSVHLLQAGNCHVLATVDGSGIKTVLALPEPFESTLRSLQAQEAVLSDSGDEVIVPMSKRALR